MSPRLTMIVTSCKTDDQVQDAVGRAVARMRLEEPVGHDAVLGHAVEHAVGADDRRVDRAGQDQEADDDDEGVEHQPRHRRPDHVHRQAADQVVGVDPSCGRRRESAARPGSRCRPVRHQAVDEDDERRLLEVRQLGRFDLAIDLGQRLLAAHGQDRMAEGDQDADDADEAQPVADSVNVPKLPSRGGVAR